VERDARIAQASRRYTRALAIAWMKIVAACLSLPGALAALLWALTAQDLVANRDRPPMSAYE
jgi:hypothetical protein